MEKSIAYSKQRPSVRERILDSAMRLFTEVGYFKTSIPDIVRVSGVSIGSIYHHFNDKEGVARALYIELTERIERDIAQIEFEHQRAEDQCRAIIELLFQITEKEPCVMEFMIYAKHKEFLPDLAPVCSSKPMIRLRELVALGVERGEFRRVDPFVAAGAIYGAAFRIIQLRLDGLIHKPVSYYLDEVWECAWRAISPDPE